MISLVFWIEIEIEIKAIIFFVHYINSSRLIQALFKAMIWFMTYETNFN